MIPSRFNIETPSFPSIDTPQRSATSTLTPRSFPAITQRTHVPSAITEQSTSATSCDPQPSRPVTPVNTDSVINSNPSRNENATEISTFDDNNASVLTPTYLTPTYLTNLTRTCCSRKNFATKLVAQLFDIETRKKSNVAGKLGKAKLNIVIMDYIKSLAFQYYPLEANEKEEKAWQACVVVIDSKSRSLKRLPVKQK